MEIKLSKADKVILTSIVHNAKMKEKDLAQKCNLSKDSIRYRIKRLENLGVITGYSIFLDYTKLGNNSYKLYLKLNGSIKSINELKKFLDSKKEVFAYFESQGTWNMAIVFFVKTDLNYYNLENELLYKFGNIITSKKFCIMVDGQIFNNKFLLEENKFSEYNVFGEIKDNKLDEIDKNIIRELHKNSKVSLVELSFKIGLSIDAIKNRIDKLEKNKVIQYYSTKIDYGILGYESYKLFINVKNYEPEVEKKIFNFIKQQKSSIDILRMIGPWKLEVEFLIKEHNEFEKIIDKLQDNFPDIIHDINYSIFRNETFYPNPELLLD